MSWKGPLNETASLAVRELSLNSTFLFSLFHLRITTNTHPSRKVRIPLVPSPPLFDPLVPSLPHATARNHTYRSATLHARQPSPTA